MFTIRKVLFFKWDTFKSCKAIYSDLTLKEYNLARGIKSEKKKAEKKTFSDKKFKGIIKDKSLDN